MPVPCRCSLSSTPFRRTSMSRFNNLRLAYRLGIAFGALVLALVVIGAISVSKINALEGQATNLSDHDTVTLEKVLTIEERDASRDYFQSTVVPAQVAATKAGDALSGAVVDQVAVTKKLADAAATSG